MKVSGGMSRERELACWGGRAGQLLRLRLPRNMARCSRRNNHPTVAAHPRPAFLLYHHLRPSSQPYQVTRRIKRTLVTAKASPSVAQRHQWTKFGAEKGKKAGPDASTTSLGSESMRIKLSVGNKDAEKQEKDESAKIKAELGGKKVSCRLCQGDHFTARCPYKDTLGEIDGELGCLWDA